MERMSENDLPLPLKVARGEVYRYLLRLEFCVTHFSKYFDQKYQSQILKFIYSEKAAKFKKIFIVVMTFLSNVKKVEDFFQNLWSSRNI